jgi:sec-independent protein translocase protein TatB
VGSVGFSEIAVIAVLALFVLGPDRLPQAARSIGRALSEFRRLTSGARADLEQALDASGMRDTLAEIRGTVDELNPRRIVTDSLRAVDEPSYGTTTPAIVSDDDPVPSSNGLVGVPPPDADVSNSGTRRAGGNAAVSAPLVGAFTDILAESDPMPTETAS